ncbi:Protein of unknown function [Cotesia congregata]|uniref:Uncharacterized protein n=1 Tax=Cotesia congregata TaxID=51543 RepID=A0A8J2H5S3_COTCN|nr:Protein of unknown function [Cotesia congregata]
MRVIRIGELYCPINDPRVLLEALQRSAIKKNRARSSLSNPALAYQSIGPGSSPAYTNEYFQYLSVLYCSAQEIQTSSNLKSLPPTVVAHDLSSLCDFKNLWVLTRLIDFNHAAIENNKHKTVDGRKNNFYLDRMEEGNEIFGENIEKSRANGCLHSRAYI